MKATTRGATCRAALVLMILGGATAAHAECEHPPAPERLSKTGLFKKGTLEVDARHLPYTPQYPLWSDGAIKRRWVSLPSAVNAADPGGWEFPLHTRFFKEFRFGNRRIETRLIERTKCGWRYVTYAWNEAQTDAVLAPPEGLPDHHEIRPGVHFSIPGTNDCEACHEGASGSEILGFSALQLSQELDPQALNKEPTRPGSLNLATMMERNLLKNAPAQWKKTPPRIPARTPLERTALGYLHGNCGNCHNARGELASQDFNLWFAPGTKREEVLATIVNVPSRFQVPETGDAPESPRVAPGHPSRSTLLIRMKSRHPFSQMPPLATRLADEAAIALIERWISEQREVPGRRSGSERKK